MKKTLVAAIMTLTPGLVGSALAADLAAKTAWKAPPPAPAFSWTSCYFGMHGGGVFASKDITSSQPIESIGVVIRMCAVDGHEPTLTPVFRWTHECRETTRRVPLREIVFPKCPEKIVRTNLLTGFSGAAALNERE